MKKLLTIVLVLLISSVFTSAFQILIAPTAAESANFKISGYILDSNGRGIAGANVIFNIPSIVPSDYSDYSGYYEMLAPAGNYRINVWPPYDSNYINYDEPGFVVGSDMTKNITLYSGYKISGYVSDFSGKPVIGAVVLLNNYGSGWFSNSLGYYFLSVPAGTYRIDAHPRTGYNYSGPTTDFPTYYENNFVVNSNAFKNITVGSPAPTPTKTKISGYVLDANGNGLSGAQVIFGVPEIVPSVYTDYSGHYIIYAPSGNYHLNVWPPFDSNYIFYDQPVFSVGTSDISKNIKLSSGYKVSGYLTDPSGTPIKGAHASLNQFHCGWYSNYSGYYFITAPAGTYALTIQPKTGSSFPIYTENNFPVTHDIYRNFTMATSNMPNPTNTPTPTQSTQTPAPISTPKPTLPSTLISISVEATTLEVGSTVNVKGRLSDQDGNPLNDKTVVLSYAVDKSSSWFQIGSGKTNLAGEYNIQWLIEASGTFNIKAEWDGNSNYLGSGNSATLCFLPYQDKKVFFVESNSTITGLDFDSNNAALGFTVSGPTETKGYTKATIAKTLASNITGFTVSLDGKQIEYMVTSSPDYWIIAFTYSHSTHQITINLSDAKVSQMPIATTTLLFAVVVIVIIGSILGFIIFKKHMK